MSSKSYALKGGLDLSESALEVYPGKLRDSLNFYESTDGGYERLGGYERFDGRASPSAETYYAARFGSWSEHLIDIEAGDDITVGPLSMHVLSVESVEDTDELLAYVCALSGTIPDDLDTSPIDWDTAASLVSLTPRDAATDENDAAYLEAAWDYTRSLVGEVPGDDTVSGVLQVDDTVVAFRNDGVVPKFYTHSSSGWVEGRFGCIAEITLGVGDIYPRETISSGAFEVAAVCDWYDADGVPDVSKAWLVLIPLDVADMPTAGADTASGGATFTITSASQPIESFGSYIQYINHNFLAGPESLASWFVDGKNMAMCYVSQYKVVLPVCSNFNALEDVCTSIAVFAEKLFTADDKGSFLTSEPSAPFNYGGQYGAATQGVGEELTSLITADSENLIVYTNRGTHRLAGTDKSNWTFLNAASSVGAYARSTQKLDDVFSFSVRGVCSLIRTDTTGGYTGGAISTSIQELISGYRGRLLCSNTVTVKEQVRWYFDDSTFLMMSRLPDDETGLRYSFATGFYPDRPVRCISTDVWSDGRERTFFTSDTGYVYEADRGSNFDGDPIYSFIDLHSNHLGAPGKNKAFKRIFFEAQAQNLVTLTLSYSLNYGEKGFEARSFTLSGGRSLYDSGLYDSALYDTTDRTRAKATLKGQGFTAGFLVEHSGKFALPFKITGYTLVYETLGRSVK